MPDLRRAIAYLAKDLATITSLETACERDEAQLDANLTSLMVGRVPDPNGGADLPATIASYLCFPGVPPLAAKPGHLELVAVGPGANPAQIKLDQDKKGNRYLFDGSAIIGANSGVVMVFKPK